jgi:hypothetical protein
MINLNTRGLLHLTGLKFGSWTVYDLSEKSTNRRKFWLCRCDCGVLRSIDTTKLLKGRTKSCGCDRKRNISKTTLDLTGLKFGRLTVYEQVFDVPETYKGSDWLCRCDCGELATAKAVSLVSGKKLSCGCLPKEMSSIRQKKLTGDNNRNFKHGLSGTSSYHKNKSLLAKFNITLDQYEEISALQGHVCAICKKPETLINPRSGKTRRLSVDHDHATGKIRGLLCDKCNRGLGQFDDNPDFLLNAHNYIIKDHET